MAAGTAELRTDIKLNTSQFEQGLERSKKRVGKWNKDTKKQGDLLNKSFNGTVKALGAIGVGISALGAGKAVFDGLMKSNQQFGDAFANTMQGCQTVFDSFVTALGNKDLSQFSNNVYNAYKAGIDKAAAYDQLGNTKMSYGLLQAETMANISDLDTQLASTPEGKLRNQLLKDRQSYINELKGFSATLSADTRNALAAGVNAQLSGVLTSDVLSKFTPEMFLEAGKVDLSANRDEQKAQAEASYKALIGTVNSYANQVNKANDIIANTNKQIQAIQDTGMGGDISAYTARIEEQKSIIAGINTAIGNTLGDADLQSLLNYVLLFKETDEGLQQVYNEIAGIASGRRQISRLERRIPGAPSSKGGVGSGTSVAESFIDQDFIDNLGNNPLQVPIVFVPVDSEELFGDNDAIIAQQEDAINSLAESYENLRYTMVGAAAGLESMFGGDTIGQGFQAIQLAKDLASSYKALDAIRMASAANNVTASETNAAASETEASAAITAFSAQLLKFFAWAGPVAPALAMVTTMAGVSLIGSAVNAIPKFAQGGIVGGGSYNGDKVPALLNSGEMVLNQREQTNLFNQLNSARQYNDSNTNNNVVFEISGDNLVGMLSKTNRKTSRV